MTLLEVITELLHPRTERDDPIDIMSDLVARQVLKGCRTEWMHEDRRAALTIDEAPWFPVVNEKMMRLLVSAGRCRPVEYGHNGARDLYLTWIAPNDLAWTIDLDNVAANSGAQLGVLDTLCTEPGSVAGKMRIADVNITLASCGVDTLRLRLLADDGSDPVYITVDREYPSHGIRHALLAETLDEAQPDVLFN